MSDGVTRPMKSVREVIYALPAERRDAVLMSARRKERLIANIMAEDGLFMMARRRNFAFVQTARAVHAFKAAYRQ